MYLCHQSSTNSICAYGLLGEITTLTTGSPTRFFHCPYHLYSILFTNVCNHDFLFRCSRCWHSFLLMQVRLPVPTFVHACYIVFQLKLSWQHAFPSQLSITRWTQSIPRNTHVHSGAEVSTCALSHIRNGEFHSYRYERRGSNWVLVPVV